MIFVVWVMISSMIKEFKKKDIVRITDGVFKDFYGTFFKMTSKGLLIEIEMFGRKVIVPLDELQIKKVIAKCFKCEKVLDLKLEETKMLIYEDRIPYGTCNKCLKEYRRFEKEVDKIPVNAFSDSPIKDMKRWIMENRKLMKKYNFVRTPIVLYLPKKMKELEIARKAGRDYEYAINV